MLEIKRPQEADKDNGDTVSKKGTKARPEWRGEQIKQDHMSARMKKEANYFYRKGEKYW